MARQRYRDRTPSYYEPRPEALAEQAAALSAAMVAVAGTFTYSTSTGHISFTPTSEAIANPPATGWAMFTSYGDSELNGTLTFGGAGTWTGTWPDLVEDGGILGPRIIAVMHPTSPVDCYFGNLTVIA